MEEGDEIPQEIKQDYLQHVQARQFMLQAKKDQEDPL